MVDRAFAGGIMFFERCVPFMEIFTLAVSVLLLSSGAYLTVKTRFFQFRHLFTSFRCILSGISQKRSRGSSGRCDGVSPVKALAAALGGSIGTANIAGVTLALVTGGPGAIFWMWVSGFLGMAVKCVEIVLALKYRQKNASGEWVGGTMYCITNGLGRGAMPIARLFALFCMLSTVFGGGMIQSNTIASGALALFNSDKLSIAAAASVVSAAICGIIIFKGTTGIMNFASCTVPLMGILYVLAGTIIIFSNAGLILPALESIIKEAFGLRSVIGGGVGFGVLRAMRVGFVKGTFSNEAGIGSAPMAHAAAATNDILKQGMLGIAEVFIDTILICTVTALVILCSGIAIPYGGANVSGMLLAKNAFATVFGDTASGVFLSVSVFLFAITSIVGWSLYGQKCAEFLFGQRAITPFRTVLVIAIALGGVISVDYVWAFGEACNLLMAVLSMPVTLLLSDRAIKLLNHYR